MFIALRSPTRQYGGFTSVQYRIPLGLLTSKCGLYHFLHSLDRRFLNRAVLEGLAKAGFKTNLGPYGAGLIALLYDRSGGYYVGEPSSPRCRFRPLNAL